MLASFKSIANTNVNHCLMWIYRVLCWLRNSINSLLYCKGDDASQWRSPKFDPHHAETPYAGVIKIGRGDYVWTPTPVQKFVTIRPGVSFPRMRDFARQIAHQKVSVFWVLATCYSHGHWADFDAKYSKTRGCAEGFAFSGSRT